MPAGARRAGLSLVVVALVAVPAVVDAATPVRPATTYRDHVLEATNALDRFSATVRTAGTIEELQQKEPELRAAVGDFVQASSSLSRYRVADSRLDRQRAALARSGQLAGKELTAHLRAVLAGDVAALTRNEAEARTRLARFSAAADLDAER